MLFQYARPIMNPACVAFTHTLRRSSAAIALAAGVILAGPWTAPLTVRTKPAMVRRMR